MLKFSLARAVVGEATVSLVKLLREFFNEALCDVEFETLLSVNLVVRHDESVLLYCDELMGSTASLPGLSAAVMGVEGGEAGVGGGEAGVGGRTKSAGLKENGDVIGVRDGRFSEGFVVLGIIVVGLHRSMKNAARLDSEDFLTRVMLAS